MLWLMMIDVVKGSESERGFGYNKARLTHNGLKIELIRHKNIVLFHLLLLFLFLLLLRRGVVEEHVCNWKATHGFQSCR